MAEQPTVEWFKKMIMDEQQGIDEYTKYGFHNLAKDEARHKEHLERFLRNEEGQKKHIWER